MPEDQWTFGETAALDQYDPAAAEAAMARMRRPYAQTYEDAQVRPTIINSLAKYPEDLARRVTQNSQFALDTGTYDPAPTLEAAGAAMTGGMPFSPRGAIGMAGGRAIAKAPPPEGVAAPAIISRAEPTPMDIAAVKARAAELKKSAWPTAQREVFATTPEAYAETTAIVPQVSIKHKLPGPRPGEELPNSGRAQPVIDNADEIAERIATRLRPFTETNRELFKFYHTAPVIRGLERHGEMTLPEANSFMRDWAGSGAATSPRTKTPPNLRNASYLLHERASGNPLDRARFEREGNAPGFGMMGMHVDLADRFAKGTENAWKNPKPTVFRENWSGNLLDVTTDTHNIRSTLYELDKLQPGKLPRGWFSSDEAYGKYLKDGFESLNAGHFIDTLGSKTVNKQPRQSEYLPMTEPWYRAAAKLGIAPAEAQSGGWFSYGDITGLGSPPKTITNLLNDQIDDTARVLKVPPEKVLNWWSRGKIPLAGIAGAGAVGPNVMGGLVDQERYNGD